MQFSDKKEYVPTHNRQRIFTENMLLNHPTLTTDSWTLYIKASILLSRVRSFNSRYWIVAASKGSGAPETSHGSPKESEGLRHLDQMIVSFTAGIPRAFRDPVEPTVDPLLYMVHLLPHMYATILSAACRALTIPLLAQGNDSAS